MTSGPATCLRTLILSFLSLFPASLLSQQEQNVRQVDTIQTSADIFASEDPMKITLTLDLKKYQREKFKGEYMPVHCRYELNDTIFLEKYVRMKARGVFRRSHCSMAPFWLDIRNSDVGNMHLQDVKRIKVVTKCKGTRAYEDYLLREYLAYKIYNIISPISFRVRLIRMKYVDTGRHNKVTEGWAFMIEPEEMLAERVGGLVIKRDDLVNALMKPAAMDLAAMYLFMIGNCDYSVRGRHNMKILGMPGFGSEGYTPVPYDFDYSGLVGASYAIPPPELGLSSVRERFYLGPCREEEDFIAAIDQIKQRREEILRMIHEFQYLDEKDKRDMIAYLEDYFSLAGTQHNLRFQLQKTCR